MVATRALFRTKMCGITAMAAGTGDPAHTGHQSTGDGSGSTHPATTVPTQGSTAGKRRRLSFKQPQPESFPEVAVNHAEPGGAEERCGSAVASVWLWRGW